MEKIDVKELKDLGLQAMKNFWGIKNGTIDALSDKQLKTLIQKAKLGMQFFKEVNVSERSYEHNTIRICTMLADNTEELSAMLKKSVPQYVIGK